MEAGVVLLVAHDVTEVLIAQNILNPTTGVFTPPADADFYGVLAVKVSESLESHGIDVPDRLEKAIKLIPLILEIAGL